jgi:hypothetical protein
MALRWVKIESANDLDVGGWSNVDLSNRLFGAVAGPNVLLMATFLTGQITMTSLNFDTEAEAQAWLQDNRSD